MVVSDDTTSSNIGSTIFGWTGVVLCFIFYFSPYFKFKKLAEGTLFHNQVPRLFIFFAFLNTLFWTSIQIQKSIRGENNNQDKTTKRDADSDVTVWDFLDPLQFGNFFALLICIGYIICWIFYVSQKSKCITIILGFLIVIISFLMLYFSYAFPRDTQILYYITSTINALMFLAPCEHLKSARQQSDIELIQLHTCLAMFSQCLAWFMYGYRDKTWGICIANGIGILSSLVNFYYFVHISVKANTSLGNALIYGNY